MIKSSKQIENDIYKFIKKTTGSVFSEDSFIKSVSEDYYSFQESFFKLTNNQISLSYEENTILFNNIIKYEIYQNNIDDIRVSFHYEGKAISLNHDIGNGFALNNCDDIRIRILSLYNINDNRNYNKLEYNFNISINLKAHENLKNVIELYLNEALFDLHKKNKKRFLEIVPFFNTIFSLSIILKRKKIDIEDHIIENKYLSKETIFDSIQNAKDIILLTNDFDINPYFETIKQNVHKEKSRSDTSYIFEILCMTYYFVEYLKEKSTSIIIKKNKK